MDAFIFRFAATQLRKVPSRYLGFLIASGHCCNEFVNLLPYIVFEHDLNEANEVESAFIFSRRLTIDRVVISKIIEYGNLCGDFFRGFEVRDEGLFRQLEEAYAPISRKIGSAKWARILRNKASFHYDKKHALESLERLDDQHPLRMFAGRTKGLTLFEFSEEIMGRSIFEAAGDGDIRKGMDAANKFVVELVSSITRFHADMTMAVFAAFGMVSEREQGVLREKYCASPDETRIPITVSSVYIDAHRRKGELGS